MLAVQAYNKLTCLCYLRTACSLGSSTRIEEIKKTKASTDHVNDTGAYRGELAALSHEGTGCGGVHLCYKVFYLLIGHLHRKLQRCNMSLPGACVTSQLVQ